MSIFKTKRLEKKSGEVKKSQPQISQVSRDTEVHLRDWTTLIRRSLFVGGGVLFIIFLLWQAVQVVSPADIYIDAPHKDLITSERNFSLEGEVDVGSSLLINGEVLLVGESGKFVKQVFLQPGINTFIFEVKKRYGKVNLVTRDIYFETETLQQPLNQTEGDSQNDNVKVKINNIIR